METLGDEKVAKSSKKLAVAFCCELCDYTCCKKFNWEKHLLTSKHVKVTQGDKKVAKSSKKGQNPESNFICEYCDKEYSSRNGLWKHKKTCKDKDNLSTEQLVLLMLQQNNKVQDALIEMSKQITTTNTNNNHSHNKTTNNNNSFNLQFFLNDTCKNAMNITDFADSIKLQLSDLISIGELGYVDGISNIIVKTLNALDVTERPVHCADNKRKIMYIKDEDKWEKDDEDKKIRKFIKKIAFKNQKLFPQFKEKYPDYNDSDSKRSNQYSTIVIESLADGDEDKENKIIKNISKAISVDKTKSE
jgi:hypothetical protein